MAKQLSLAEPDQTLAAIFPVFRTELPVPMTIRVVARTPRRALVVADDAASRERLRLHLSHRGMHVIAVADGGRALAHLRSIRFDLIVLDAMLPDVNGNALCDAIRADGANRETAILMLTVRDMKRELLARVGAILWRQSTRESAGEQASQAHSRNVLLNADTRQVVVRGEPVTISKEEFDLLDQLLSHPGIVFSRQALLTKVWGDDTYMTERAVDTVVSGLRRKIERNAQDPELILTVWGVGYKFVDGA